MLQFWWVVYSSHCSHGITDRGRRAWRLHQRRAGGTASARSGRPPPACSGTGRWRPPAASPPCACTADRPATPTGVSPRCLHPRSTLFYCPHHGRGVRPHRRLVEGGARAVVAEAVVVVGATAAHHGVVERLRDAVHARVGLPVAPPVLVERFDAVEAALRGRGRDLHHQVARHQLAGRLQEAQVIGRKRRQQLPVRLRELPLLALLYLQRHARQHAHTDGGAHRSRA
ncbi:hypothetical protein ON010_g11628 [Phytophthora cinnamomi]|nr:hypothetical protein ON010_g11628 [Phytophthora cinnamomi]